MQNSKYIKEMGHGIRNWWVSIKGTARSFYNHDQTRIDITTRLPSWTAWLIWIVLAGDSNILRERLVSHLSTCTNVVSGMNEFGTILKQMRLRDPHGPTRQREPHIRQDRQRDPHSAYQAFLPLLLPAEAEPEQMSN